MKFFLGNAAARFLVAGSAAAGVSFTVLYLFTDVLGWWYLSSSILAFCLAVSLNFVLQKFWVFRENLPAGQAGRHRRLTKQALMFFSIAIVNLGLNTLLMYFFVDCVHFHYLAAQFFAAGIIAVGSFLTYRHLIFPADQPVLSTPSFAGFKPQDYNKNIKNPKEVGRN